MNWSPCSAFALTRCQALPAKWSIALSGASTPPMAQMLDADTALARSSPTALPVFHCFQFLPSKCQVPSPPVKPPPPNTQTLDGLSAVTPVNSPVPGNFLAVHFDPL